jgi:hypothetical protein
MTAKEWKIGWVTLHVAARHCRKSADSRWAYLLYQIMCIESEFGQVYELKRMFKLPMEKK